jgi:ankyrin repeat protein
MATANDKLVNAAYSGDVAEIERLIAAGADPNADIGTGAGRPLRAAAENGHVAAMAALLKAGAHVKGATSAGITALVLAAGRGHTAAVDALVAAGADVHHANKNGDTALHRASVNGRLDAARALLEAGAKTDVCNKEGKRPIDVVRELAHSLRLLDCGTPLRRRVAVCRLAALSQRWPPCVRCWSGRPP